LMSLIINKISEQDIKTKTQKQEAVFRVYHSFYNTLIRRLSYLNFD